MKPLNEKTIEENWEDRKWLWREEGKIPPEARDAYFTAFRDAYALAEANMESSLKLQYNKALNIVRSMGIPEERATTLDTALLVLIRRFEKEHMSDNAILERMDTLLCVKSKLINSIFRKLELKGNLLTGMEDSIYRMIEQYYEDPTEGLRNETQD